MSRVNGLGVDMSARVQTRIIDEKLGPELARVIHWVTAMVNNYIISIELCFLIIDRRIAKPILPVPGSPNSPLHRIFSKHPPSASCQTPSINFLCYRKDNVFDSIDLTLYV